MLSHHLKARFPLVAILLLLACSPSDKDEAPAATSLPARQAAAVPTVELPSFVTLVRKEGPAVVNISSTRTIRQNADALPGIPQDDPFFEFFRRFMPPSSPREFQARSLGSGFIISQDGYILTNAHVVADTDEVSVKLTTKRDFKAKVIGADPRTDVALLKIDSNALPIVAIGDPGKLEVGGMGCRDRRAFRL
jgi:serine protease Do